ncbi:MAG TPA: hypothetical protein PLD95_03030 [bacterium]|jgi:hypothetical protein|nr:hypothetical protein [bacterium]HOG38421.1 hypothetical protein [bacterium]HQI03318.1 hypothetical protein [bacterium]
MKSKFKLFILFLVVFSIFLIWLFIKQLSSFDLKLVGEEMSDIKTSFMDVWNSDTEIFNDYSPGDDVETIKSAIKNGINNNDDDNLTTAVENGVKKQLEETKIEYIYEPWKIKISYFNDSSKSFDEKSGKIIVKYDDNNFLDIKKETFKEKRFDDWLVKHFDIQKLNKETINSIVFWSTESSKDNIFVKNYIINIGRDIYQVIYHCDVGSMYCVKLNEVAQTFESIK